MARSNQTKLSPLVQALVALHAEQLLLEGAYETARPDQEDGLLIKLGQVRQRGEGLLQLLKHDHHYSLSWIQFRQQGKKALRDVLGGFSVAEAAAILGENLPLQPKAPSAATVRKLTFRAVKPEVEVDLFAVPAVRSSSPAAGLVVDAGRAEEDFEYFCLAVLKIDYRKGVRKDLGPGVTQGPFRWTEPQAQLASFLVLYMLVKQVPLRVIILKARQLGFTTLILAFWAWLGCTHAAFKVMFLIDKNEHNATKMRLMRQWLERDIPRALPTWPRFKKQDGNQLVITNGSVVFFESAESENPGTSEGLSGYHESEMPKWKGDPVTIRKSVTPGLPDSSMTAHINESTAWGMEYFHSQWEQANSKDRTPEDPIPLFFPWFLSPEYSTPPPPECFLPNGKFVFEDGNESYWDSGAEGIELTEREYAQKYKLSFGQIYWRRMRIRAFNTEGNRQGRSGRDSFDVEFPTTPRHAFRTTTSHYFSLHLLLQAEKHSIRPPRWIGDLVPTRLIQGVPSYEEVQPQFVEDEKGPLRVYSSPKEGHQYYLGGDVAEGKEVDPDSPNSDPDYTVFSVKDSNGVLVALWRSRREPEDCWMPLLLLGLWYKQALVNVERDGPGEVLLSWFWQTNYPHNLIWAEPKARPIKQRAWTIMKGNHSRRTQFLALLRSSLQQLPARLVAREQLDEYLSFQQNPRTGRPEARTGRHDDIVMADLYAEVARQWEKGFVKSQLDEEAGGPIEVIPLEPSVVNLAAPTTSEVFFLDGQQEMLHDLI